jgi:type II secretion system protein N
MTVGPPRATYVPSSSKPRLHGYPPRPKLQRLLPFVYGVFAAILFTAFLAASFPYAETISALIAPMKIKMVFQRQEMNFPLGARLENVRLLSLTNQQLLLQSPAVTIAPRVSWLLFGRPCLRIHALIYGGVLDASVYSSAPAVMVDFHLTSLNLAGIISAFRQQQVPAQTERNEKGQALPQLGITLSGELSGRGLAQVTGVELTAARASIVLVGRHIRAAIIDGLPSLDLRVVRGKVLLDRGVATLQDVSAVGSAGEVKAQGEIQLAPDIARSTVRLTVSLAPTAKGRASFGPLLNMLPHAPSDGPYQLEGVLTSPSLT